MRLSSFFIVTFGIGVLSYPVFNLPSGKPFLLDSDLKGKQAEPIPRPDRPKTDFAMLGGGTIQEEAKKDKEYRIIVNIPATKLTVLENENVVEEFQIAVGQPIYKTPTGEDKITQIIWNPWWHPPKSEWAKDEKITPPGPKNPLGPVKMVLNGDIRMHGTTADRSIGSAASHGCIRLHSKDAIKLAWLLQSNLTEKNDPGLLEKYRAHASTSFWVKLPDPIRVNIVYDPLAFVDESIILYPDIYGKIKDVKELAAWKLFSHGIAPWALDLDKLPELKRRSSQTVEIGNLR